MKKFTIHMIVDVSIEIEASGLDRAKQQALGVELKDVSEYNRKIVLTERHPSTTVVRKKGIGSY